ncbi:glutathione S-transferase family protein [Trinickia mobilis]|uniref:glutathione S-transferase family protein n=1 Tax=Trinickia mobilis TaxID=2816356 RepID=UPI001A904471|nr:glutathione S-transferase family protein [Trinickia mobilis]
MSDTRPTCNTYTLWGGALSLFTGKVRSYLIKKGIPYREFYAGHPDFQSRIRPIVRLGVAPVLETPQGEVLQDSTEIIDFMERRLPEPAMIPASPVQRVVAWLLAAYGTEHLRLPAMHYRWAEPYLSEQRSFLDAEFGRVSYLGNDRQARNAAGARMIDYFSGRYRTIGGSPEAAPAIEGVYLELLELLDIHFQHVPYLLGGHPSIADFGLMAPLFAHLGRDPAPARIMALRAPNVLRWVERMNLAVIPDAEYPDIAPAFPADDALPRTLEPVLEMLFRDWTAELLANAACYHAWLAAYPDLPAGQFVTTDTKRRVHPTLGPIEFKLRGVTIRRSSAPQMLWHFDKAAALARDLDGEARTRFTALLRRVGGEEAMAISLARPIVRNDYLLAVG